MRLRNKKTGEVFDVLIREKGGGGSYSLIVCDIKAYEQSKSTLDATHFILDEYDSLAELNGEWEDYTPKEPLIKDEKIRKAVRAWAEADDLDNFRVQNQHFNDCKIIGYTAGINKASFIGFQTTIANADNKKLYDITELCGEEEE